MDVSFHKIGTQPKTKSLCKNQMSQQHLIKIHIMTILFMICTISTCKLKNQVQASFVKRSTSNQYIPPSFTLKANKCTFVNISYEPFCSVSNIFADSTKQLLRLHVLYLSFYRRFFVILWHSRCKSCWHHGKQKISSNSSTFLTTLDCSFD